MLSKLILPTAISVLSGLASAQLYSSCNPVTGNVTCPPDPALGSTKIDVDFTNGAADEYFTNIAGTRVTYDPTKGAVFNISTSDDSPTIVTNKYIFFGHIDVVFTAAPGVGVVTAITLQSNDLDEIDWEWIGGETQRVQSNFFSKGSTVTYDRAETHSVANAMTETHTYSIDWTAERLQWLIDGTVVRTLNYADVGPDGYPQTPSQVRLGTWVAGKASSSQGLIDWSGGLTDFSKAPFVAYIKSVSITDYSNGVSSAKEYVWTDSTGRYQSINVVTEESAVNSSSSISSMTTTSTSSATSATASTTSTLATSISASSSASIENASSLSNSTSTSGVDSASAITNSASTSSVDETGETFATSPAEIAEITTSGTGAESAINSPTIPTATTADSTDALSSATTTTLPSSGHLSAPVVTLSPNLNGTNLNNEQVTKSSTSPSADETTCEDNESQTDAVAATSATASAANTSLADETTCEDDGSQTDAAAATSATAGEATTTTDAKVAETSSPEPTGLVSTMPSAEETPCEDDEGDASNTATIISSGVLQPTATVTDVSSEEETDCDGDDDGNEGYGESGHQGHDQTPSTSMTTMIIPTTAVTTGAGGEVTTVVMSITVTVPCDQTTLASITTAPTQASAGSAAIATTIAPISHVSSSAASILAVPTTVSTAVVAASKPSDSTSDSEENFAVAVNSNSTAYSSSYSEGVADVSAGSFHQEGSKTSNGTFAGSGAAAATGSVFMPPNQPAPTSTAAASESDAIFAASASAHVPFSGSIVMIITAILGAFML